MGDEAVDILTSLKFTESQKKYNAVRQKFDAYFMKSATLYSSEKFYLCKQEIG